LFSAKKVDYSQVFIFHEADVEGQPRFAVIARIQAAPHVGAV